MSTQEASRALREAASLSPDNPDVRAAFDRIRQDESVHPLAKLVHRFTQEKDEAAGKEAVDGFGQGSEIPDSVAEMALRMTIAATALDENDIRDQLVANLLQNCHGAKKYLAKRMQDAMAVVFNEVYEIGDGAANGMNTVVLDASVWTDASAREACERDIFQMFIAKLMESGHDHDGRALKGVSRLLTLHADSLQHLIDEEVFDLFLVSLDDRLSMEVRGLATLATAKYMEVANGKAHQYFSNFVASRVMNQTADDLIIAFSAAAAVFPLVPSVASALFLTDGFLPSMMPLLQKKLMSLSVEQAALDMLNAACIDKACREAIAKHSLSWLEHTMEVGVSQSQGQAAVVLAKVRQHGAVNGAQVQEVKEDNGDIVPILRKMLLSKDKSHHKNAIEGLAFVSIQPAVKERLAKDEVFLRALLQFPDKRTNNATSIFGSLTLIDNLTKFLPNISEEQKKMDQLKAYASASKPPQVDVLDDDAHAIKRCDALLHAGVIPFLISLQRSLMSNQPSQASLGLIANIMLSLSRSPSTRGRIAQQGGIPLLLQLYKHITLPSSPARATAAHALSRILISVDPKLVFGSRSPSSAIPLILSLIKEEDPTTIFTDTTPRSLLPIFEALLALTNLVSDPTLATAPEVLRSGVFPRIEDLMLSSNSLLQRAATELVCNLMASPEGLEKYADGSAAASRRLHILVALTDVDDTPTRRAAGGALAMITEFPAAVTAILNRERGLQLLFNLCQDEDVGCIQRSLVCIRNIVFAEGEAGKRGKQEVLANAGTKLIKDVLKVNTDHVVLETGVEILKALV